MANHFVQGLFAELITPFNEDRSIDRTMMGDLVDFQIANGVSNFFVNGLGGECHELTFDEKMDMLRIVHDRTKGKGHIMGCSFEADLIWNKQLLTSYMESGLCDSYCITAPPFFRHTQEALYDWSAQLIQHCDKPCYIYNCVQMGTLYEPQTLAKLQKNLPNFRGYKDATTDILHFQQTMLRIDSDHFDFLGGCDGLDGVMMLLGAVGAVSFLAIPFPREMNEIIQAGLAGDSQKCMEAQYKVLKIRNVLKLAPFNAAYMYAQKFTGGPVVKYSRMPHHQDFVPDEVKAIIDQTMKEIGY